MKKVLLILFAMSFMLSGCASSDAAIQNAIAATQLKWTPIPSQTPYATYTPIPTNTPNPTSTPLVVTLHDIWTPTPDLSDSSCTPITNMDYSNNSKVGVLLQAYVSSLPDVKSVSYTIPERLYSNTLSQIIFVQYVNTDGKIFAKRYIVYMKEFGWFNGVFSIDGQCWIDPPR
jgi:hypothetical protein